jgi:cysteine synthase A
MTVAGDTVERIATADGVVAGVGTGETITDVSAHLKKDHGKTGVTSVAVEPEASLLLSVDDLDRHEVRPNDEVRGPGDERSESSGIQRIGPGFASDVLWRELLDEVRTISADDAREASGVLSVSLSGEIQRRL